MIACKHEKKQSCYDYKPNNGKTDVLANEACIDCKKIIGEWRFLYTYKPFLRFRY
jgi:hypothetical protein